MAEIDLMQAVTTNGIRTANYFNGRVLTAEDLSADQQARRQQLAQLAIAVGSGVVRGFDVSLQRSTASASSLPTTGQTTVRVTKGLAINEDGDAIALGADVDVALVKVEAAQAADDGLFAPCSPLLSSTLTNPGLYVLTARPASSFAERAPMTELGGDGIASACGSRYAVEGAEFRLAVLDPGAASGPGMGGVVATLLGDIDTKIVQASSLTSLPLEQTNQDIMVATARLRNAVAYLCFGAESFTDFSDSPFPRADGRLPGARYGALDAMRGAGKLASCEVPLALIFWSRRGVEFVDAWAVRRPVHAGPLADSWSPADRRRRGGEALAMLLQFQAQLEDIRGSTRSDADLAALRARDLFSLLPPCGFVPIAGGAGKRSFTIARFFDGIATAQFTVIAPEKVEALAQEALAHPPVSLAGKAMVQVYVASRATGALPAQPYALFVTRAVHGPLEDDSVARVFRAAWDAYRGLVKNRTFLPMDNSSDSEGARIAMLAAEQDVMTVATREGVLAAGRQLAYDDALGALQALYDVEDELCTLLATGLSGIIDLNDRAGFAAGLRSQLDVALGDGSTALAPALAAGDLLAAIAAQQAINQRIATWSGGGVAIGDIIVNYTGDSPEGTTLAIGSATVFRHRFVLLNKTDQPLKIQLSAAIAAAGSWVGNLPGGNSKGGAVEVQSPEGTAVSADGVTVQKFGSRAFTVAIKTPSDAVAGAGAATLKVDAVSGPPSNKTYHFEKAFDVGDNPTGPSTRNVVFASVSPEPTSGNVSPTTVVNWSFRTLYSDSKSQTDGTFKLVLTLTATSGDVTGWGPNIKNYSVDTKTDVPTKTTTVTLSSVTIPVDSVGKSFLVALRAPASTPGTAQTVSIKFRIEATDDAQVHDERTWTQTVPG